MDYEVGEDRDYFGDHILNDKNDENDIIDKNRAVAYFCQFYYFFPPATS